MLLRAFSVSIKDGGKDLEVFRSFIVSAICFACPPEVGSIYPDDRLDPRIHKWVLPFATPPFSTGLEKPCRLQAKGGLNRHLGWH